MQQRRLQMFWGARSSSCEECGEPRHGSLIFAGRGCGRRRICITSRIGRITHAKEAGVDDAGDHVQRQEGPGQEDQSSYKI